ncbi:hypothetical protein HOLleu_14319 [Holothuria leucospilota]|uniref:Uncharacterized protein n=1 Tax=Holothuria leucospilota TaxID=206669 RepID=A0A9Q1C8Q6_HOLLE|nr:hypothetical protein HOLleu_14319 [Holothuria leucospilota]
MDLKALRDHFNGEREVLISESVEEGLNLCQEWEVGVERRRRRKKRMPSENSRDTGLTAKEEMERIMEGTLDRLNREMDEMFQRLDDTDSNFGFLLRVQGLCNGTVSEELYLQENCKSSANSKVLILMENNCVRKFWNAGCRYLVDITR